MGIEPKLHIGFVLSAVIVMIFSASFHSVAGLQKMIIINENNCSIDGRISECNRDEEFFMESEVSERFLQAPKPPPLITSNANKPVKPFCESRGRYRSCKHGAGQYKDDRGCQAIYGCRK
uniref:Rapid ALkalinization Factor n=1 Tax=Davidia involucrata TaxID=16924 RepID=A0A5B6ZQN3_DAVIN